MSYEPPAAVFERRATPQNERILQEKSRYSPSGGGA